MGNLCHAPTCVYELQGNTFVQKTNKELKKELRQMDYQCDHTNVITQM